ncbi:CRE-REPS-1 protein [Caenorhabditis remanei]|uniref:CRE-REPS-1 protein n=1 Tax=Caenorhabditis remanei TaxID=31234 RepID=E3N0K3_CAERE|nr:CRE-REPS-1 protein [Caenorhabditis remanei]
MTENDKKSSYFSNSDFEKVAADIISSPRRLKHASPADSTSDSLFKITPKQQEYYTKCFRHLIKTTQGAVDLSGALCGADQRIVAFFKRSALDMGSLSKIWSLADVNEDGWLDLNEFSIAMHLVVLKVKGEVPIPDALPIFARPPITEPREREKEMEKEKPAVSPAVSLGTVEISDGPVKSWTTQPIIKQFSDTPPLLVDSRPTAIKHSALLALKSPLGPPPAPPARPQQRGHNRSASLDLKLIAVNSKNGGKVSDAPPNTLSLWSSHSDPPQPTSVSTTTTTTTFASFPATPDSIPPPIPQRITPSPLPFQRVIEEEKRITTDASTQTTGIYYDEEGVKSFFSKIGAQIDDLLGEEQAATDGQGMERWNKRCAALRIQNAELEAERARLAQVRIQLEIRVQEFEERSKTACSSATL